jgi:hypothetical protein
MVPVCHKTTPPPADADQFHAIREGLSSMPEAQAMTVEQAMPKSRWHRRCRRIRTALELSHAQL